MGGRDANGISRIGRIHLDPSNLSKIEEIEKQPVFDIGLPGTFDENGVSYPTLVKHNGASFLFYTGWVKGGRGGFQTHIGLAKFNPEKGIFERQSNAPLFERTNEEPIGTGSLSISQVKDKFVMWYTCFERWIVESDGTLKPSYWIKYAESKNLLIWTRTGHVCIPPLSTADYITSKPSVLVDSNNIKMWYSHRGISYRIGYAESRDGKTWIRNDKSVGIDVGPELWDSEMICYPCVFDYQGSRYMLYNGNGYGKTGVGLAIWKDT